MEPSLVVTKGRLKFTARPIFFLIVTAALLGPAGYIGFTLNRILAPFHAAQRLTAQVRWMPFYADLLFFRRNDGAAGTENTLLMYAAKDNEMRSALKNIPIRRLEAWQPGVDSGAYSGLVFLAKALGMPERLLPDQAAKTLLFCHTPFEAPGVSRYRSFAIADTARGMIWIGHALSPMDAPYAALEAFYQASNNQFKRSERAEVTNKIGYLETNAPGEPGLSVLLALRHLQNTYRSGGPFKVSS